ncbi:MAG: SCO family protein, partial [Pseudomonadota bacterium]
DSAERLAQYLKHFDPTFVGLRGDPLATRELTRGLGVVYRIADDAATNPAYLVDHPAAFMLIGPSPNLHAIFSAPHDPRGIAADYVRIVEAHL